MVESMVLTQVNTYRPYSIGWKGIVSRFSHHSENLPQVAREVIQVARNGAVVAINCDFNPLSSEKVSEQLGYLSGLIPFFLVTKLLLALKPRLYKGSCATISITYLAKWYKKRLKTVSGLLGLFGNAVDAVYFSYEIFPTRVNKLGNIAVIFSIKK